MVQFGLPDFLIQELVDFIISAVISTVNPLLKKMYWILCVNKKSYIGMVAKTTCVLSIINKCELRFVVFKLPLLNFFELSISAQGITPRCNCKQYNILSTHFKFMIPWAVKLGTAAANFMSTDCQVYNIIQQYTE